MASGAVTGCSPASRINRPAQLEVRSDGGEVLQLRAVGEAGARVRPDQLCAPGGPVVAPDDVVVDCGLLPLVTAVSTWCELPGFTSGDRLCRPADPRRADAVIGWVLTSSGPGRHTLALYSGRSSPPPDTPTGTMAEASLERRYVAAENAGGLTGASEPPRWSEIAVCPDDVDGNGGLDLVILVRGANREQADRPEVVVVSFLHERPGQQAAPPLQRATAGRGIDRAEGEGCASPLVEELVADGNSLRLRRAPDV
jgi:hypothetical protein